MIILIYSDVLNMNFKQVYHLFRKFCPRAPPAISYILSFQEKFQSLKTKSYYATSHKANFSEKNATSRETPLNIVTNAAKWDNICKSMLFR